MKKANLFWIFILHSAFCILHFSLILAAAMAVFAPAAFAQETQDKSGGFWDAFGGFRNFALLSVLIPFFFASINYLIKLFKKDKVLKRLLNKYIVFELKDKKTRYRGTMRLESNGVEIVSEESRQRGHAPSYILHKDDKGDLGIIAYIRYLDSMNEREKQERNWDFERVYHPRFPTRLRRKIRNFGVALRDSVNQTVSMLWGQIKKSAVFKPVQRYQQDVDTAQKELYEYAMQESYERLIERLIGTRIKVRAETGEYVGVLKEYNEEHLYLMEVKRPDGLGYLDEWEIELDIEHNKVNIRDDRGLRSRIEGRDLILENNTPYEIQLWGLRYVRDEEEDKHNWEWNYRIAPFSTQKIFLEPRPKNYNVGPFTRIVTQEPRTHKYFKKLLLNYRSFRVADIVFPRRYCRIIESAEKYQPELFDLGGLTEAILDPKRAKNIAITDKDGHEIKGINVIHGYITNVNEDRIDLKAIDQSYSRRWGVEHVFRHFDNKLRTAGPARSLVSPKYRARMAAQTILTHKIGDNPPAQEVLSPTVYTPVFPRVKPYKRKELPLKIVALTGNVTKAEIPALEQIQDIRGHRIICQPVRDLRTNHIARTHLLWIGHGEIYKNGYRLDIDTEHRIKNFVSRGGIVIVSGQDISNMRRQRQSVGWVPEPLIGVEYQETVEFTPTREGKKSQIFYYPHRIQSGQVKLDDMWLDRLNKYVLLAKANGGDEAALLLLRFQKGMYIITSLKNQDESDVHVNRAMMENLLYFSVRWFDRQKRPRLYYTP